MKYILAAHVGDEVIMYTIQAKNENDARSIVASKHSKLCKQISTAIPAYSGLVQACYIECTSAMNRLTAAMSKDPMCRKEQFDYMEACTRLIGSIGEDNG